MNQSDKDQEQDHKDMLKAMTLLNTSLKVITRLLEEQTKQIYETIKLRKENERLKNPFVAMDLLADLTAAEIERRKEEEEKGE